MKDLERAQVVTEIHSLRSFLIAILIVAVLSLGLNAVRTYLVDTQIKQLQKENMQLRVELKKGK